MEAQSGQVIRSRSRSNGEAKETQVQICGNPRLCFSRLPLLMNRRQTSDWKDQQGAGRAQGSWDGGHSLAGSGKEKGVQGQGLSPPILQRGGSAPRCCGAHRAGGPGGGSGQSCQAARKSRRGSETGPDLGHARVLLAAPGRADISPLLLGEAELPEEPSGEAPSFRTWPSHARPPPRASRSRRAFMLGKSIFSRMSFY